MSENNRKRGRFAAYYVSLHAVKCSKNRPQTWDALSLTGIAELLMPMTDESWAKINVAALATDKPNEYTLKLRLNKEMWRACAFVCGGCYTESPACLLKPARDLQELDAIKGTTIGPDSFLRIHSYLVDAKCAPAGMTTYRNAVMEGWAPAPTNDIQRAVWDAVKSAK